jgi:hypothetical protein
MTRYALTLLLLSALSTSVTATQVYRWTDAAGVVNYGPQPPPSIPATRVTLTHDNETDAQAKARLDQLIEEANLGAGAQAKDERREQSAHARKAAADEHQRECITVTHSLEKLQNWAKHILIHDGYGNPTTLNSVQREAAIERARSWLAENKCP